jgi:hypothetical protein
MGIIHSTTKPRTITTTHTSFSTKRITWHPSGLRIICIDCIMQVPLASAFTFGLAFFFLLIIKSEVFCFPFEFFWGRGHFMHIAFASLSKQGW